MKTSEAFPSKYLKADDLQGRDVAVTIANVSLEDFDGDRGKESKLVIGFKGKDKKFIVNKTNCKTISKVLGSDETDDWIGKSIVIGPREIEFNGDVVWSIRVSLKAPAQAPAPKAAKPAPSDNDGALPEEDGPGF